MITSEDVNELLKDLTEEIKKIGLDEEEAKIAVDTSYEKANLLKGGDYALWIFHRSFDSLVQEIIEKYKNAA